MKTLLHCLAKLLALLPLRAARGIARAVATLLSRVFRVRRAVVLDALAQSLPGLSPRDRVRLYREICLNQVLTFVELLRFVGGRTGEFKEHLDVTGVENAAAAHAQGKGVLVLIAHYGNYPLLALHVPSLFGYPLALVAKPLRNKALSAAWFDLFAKHGCNAIPAPSAYRSCLRALRAGQFVGFMLDQNRPAPHGVFVPFFGRPASTTNGLAILAAQTAAPTLPVFMHRTPEGRHHLVALPPIPPPADRAPATLLAFTARCTAIIEEQIRLHPAQWLWFHKRWKTQPPPPDAPPPNA